MTKSKYTFTYVYNTRAVKSFARGPAADGHAGRGRLDSAAAPRLRGQTAAGTLRFSSRGRNDAPPVRLVPSNYARDIGTVQWRLALVPVLTTNRRVYSRHTGGVDFRGIMTCGAHNNNNNNNDNSDSRCGAQ